MKDRDSGQSWPTEMELVEELGAEDLAYSAAAKLFSSPQRAAAAIAAFVEHGLFECVDPQSGRRLELWELRKGGAETEDCIVRLTDRGMRAWETGPWSVFEPVLKRLNVI